MGDKLALSIKASMNILPQLAGMVYKLGILGQTFSSMCQVSCSPWQLIPGGEVAYF